jgi:L-fucose isomerase
VHLYPEVFFCPAGGASVRHVAAPGVMTLARLDAPAEVFLSRFGANHIHAVPGDRRAELRAVCELLDITLDEFTRG